MTPSDPPADAEDTESRSTREMSVGTDDSVRCKRIYPPLTRF